MTERVSRKFLERVILIAIGFLAGILVIEFSNLRVIGEFRWGPSIRRAYEQGYEDARSVLLDTLYSRWFNDSLGWGSEIDPTDTMPAVKAAWDSRTKPTILWDTGGAR